MDELMKLFASKSAPLDLLLVGIILATTMLIEVTLFLGLFLVIPLIALEIPTTMLMEITINYPLI